MGEVSGSQRSESGALVGKISKFFDRELNLGALTMILIIVNGSFALFFGMLRNRIYNDYIGLIVALVLATNIATTIVWFMRTPKGSSKGRTGTIESARVPGEKGRRQRRKKHRHGR
jgi:hypothetical protein